MLSMASAWLLLSLMVLSAESTSSSTSIGVCFGRNGDNLPSAEDTVRLYKANGISKMRLYSPDEDALQALHGSGITTILGVPNDGVLQSLGSDASAAATWVRNNVAPYAANVKYIAVGNVVMPGDPDAPFVLPAMQNVQNALAASNLAGRIGVSTAVKSSLLLSSVFPPSSGDFGSNRGYFTPIVKFLKSNGSPLLANVYPYFTLVGGNVSLPYALLTDSAAAFTDSSNGLVYRNLFDAVVDSFYSAMEKVGGTGVGIVVSETGWPSQGSQPAATPGNAGAYYKNLIGHVAGGTPRNPGQPLETYLFAMFDEDQKPGDEVERHFGLFTPDERNKYGVAFTSVPTLLGYLCYD